MKNNTIHIVGASGAGTSALGQALERDFRLAVRLGRFIHSEV
jgi:adenylate kinase family enzyme